MMDGKMIATAVNSQNPLHIPELLDNILGFLPVKDLKSCRLVNKFWKDTALIPMRKKCANIKFGGRTKEYHGLESVEKFLQCFSADPADRDSGLLSSDSKIQADIPCTKFQIYTGKITVRKSDREKLIMANFFKAISPWVTEFTLEEGKDIGRLLKGLEDLNFPSLKRIIFSKVGYQISATFNPWMSVFITNSPQLEKLGLTSVFGRDPLFFQFLSQNKGLKIKQLSLDAKVEGNDLLVLTESDLKLKSLTLRMNLTQPRERITALLQLLQTQSETLEKFSISHSYESSHGDVAEGVSLQVMKQLKALTIHGNYPGLINYAIQTPSLEMIETSGWPGFLNEETKPAPNVKKICYQRTRPTAEAILQMGRIFPNLRKLEIQADKESLPIVYNSLPNLEELTLNTYGGSIDALLTGLTDKGYQRSVRALRNWTRDFDDSGIQIGIEHSPISVLTNLKLLRLRWKSDSRRRKFEITQVSFCLVLMKMPSLQILDLCHRREAPDQVIPCEVLKEFRKNCVILWNNFQQ